MRKLAFLVVVLATVVMFYRINRYPISLSIYEGLNGLTATQIIEGDQAVVRRVWEKPIRNQAGGSAGIASADNNIFFIFPTVFFMEFFGYRDSYLTLRLTSMIYGVLSVWLLYLLGAKMFNQTVGVIAAFFQATSSWALAYSRISLDLSASIFFVLVCFYLYAVVDRPYNPLGYIILGGLMGLATYFYVPVRVVFPLVVITMLLRMIFERGYFKKHYQYFLLMIGGFLLSLHLQGGNLNTYFVQNVPFGFGAWSKSSDMWSLVLKNVYSLYHELFGEWGWSHSSIAERGGSFDSITGFCFLGGFLWLVINIKKHECRLVIFWVLSGIFPMIITTGETRRAFMATTPIYLIAAVGIYYLLYYATKWMGRCRVPAMAVLVLTIILPIGYLNLENYFGLYEEAFRDKNNKYVKHHDQRTQLTQLMKDSKVFSDHFRAELGWPQGIEYEARRLGFTRDRYELLPPDHARKEFTKCSPPCALYLKSGELEIKERPPREEKPGPITDPPYSASSIDKKSLLSDVPKTDR